MPRPPRVLVRTTVSALYRPAAALTALALVAAVTVWALAERHQNAPTLVTRPAPTGRPWSESPANRPSETVPTHPQLPPHRPHTPAPQSVTAPQGTDAPLRAGPTAAAPQPQPTGRQPQSQPSSGPDRSSPPPQPPPPQPQSPPRTQPEPPLTQRHPEPRQPRACHSLLQAVLSILLGCPREQ